MTLNEVKEIMQKEHDLDNNKPHPCWADIDAVPHGVIENEEQYNYIIEYSRNTSVGLDGMKPYQIAQGMYLGLGNYFGGSAFYFTLMTVEYAKSMKNKYPDIYPDDLSWSYGEYGKIEWE